MRFAVYALAAASVMVTGAFADPIADRKENMKERGSLMRILAPIAQGQQPFDAATVMDALEKLQANAEAAELDVMWPVGSETGDTKSSPKIWEDRAGFQAADDKYDADVAAAVAANPQDLAAFQAVFGPVASNCGSCHEAFRM